MGCGLRIPSIRVSASGLASSISNTNSVTYIRLNPGELYSKHEYENIYCVETKALEALQMIDKFIENHDFTPSLPSKPMKHQAPIKPLPNIPQKKKSDTNST